MIERHIFHDIDQGKQKMLAPREIEGLEWKNLKQLQDTKILSLGSRQ